MFKGITPLWQVDPDFVWQCYNLLVAKAQIVLSNRNKVHRPNDVQPEEEIDVELKAEIPKLGDLDIKYVYWLAPLIVALPKLPDFPYEHSDPRILNFIDEIVALNNKANKHSQMTRESRKHQLFQVPREWEEPLYDLLANWTLNLPFDVACKHIIDPIIDAWEEGTGALANLLDTILTNVESSIYEERFIQIWKYTIPRIMRTETVQNAPQGRRNTHLEYTYSCLALMTKYGILEVWKERDWNPAPSLTDELALWVEKLAHYRANFSVLVRMLRTVGKPISMPHGVNWLFEAFQRAEKPDRLFANSSDYSALSRLLHEIWFEYGTLADDKTLLQRFSFLVDYLASKGDQIAIELQRKYQA